MAIFAKTNWIFIEGPYKANQKVLVGLMGIAKMGGSMRNPLIF